jgi:hypothetical protein
MWLWVPIVEVCRLCNKPLTPSTLLIKTHLGQAQYIRIPYADFNALKLPPGKDHESDFILLAGMFPYVFRLVCIAYSNYSRTDVFPTGVPPFVIPLGGGLVV